MNSPLARRSAAPALASPAAGGSLLVVDDGAMLFIGRLAAVPAHRCAATVVAFGLDQPFELTTTGGVTRGRMLMAAPGVVRSVEGFGGRMAVCLIDPAMDVLTCPDEMTTLDLLSGIDVDNVAAQWPRVLDALRAARPTVVDPRVAAVADALRRSSGEVITIDTLARGVGLSPSRLAHLFKAQIGIPMRAFRTWCRFRAAAQALAAGCDLTAAAQLAGFFDQAHFTNTFRRWFGIVPSFLFSPGLSIHICHGA